MYVLVVVLVKKGDSRYFSLHLYTHTTNLYVVCIQTTVTIKIFIMYVFIIRMKLISMYVHKFII